MQMNTLNIKSRYGLGLFGFILFALSISYVVYPSNTQELTFINKQPAQLDNLIDFALMPIQCNVIFDIYKFGFCKDVPFYYYSKTPEEYNKEIYYFNTRIHINYTKIKKCQIDDMILYLNRLDTRFINMFWIIS